MVNRLLWILLFSLLAFAPVQAQDVDISVDRSEIARGETLILTIRVYDQRQGIQLDLTPLTEDFDVLGTRTSSQVRSVNGAVEAWTDYVVTLFPLNEGEVTIPSLNINDTQTDPLAVNVVNEGPRSNQSDEELFLEIDVNKDSVYVQEQLRFNLRLYYTINGIRNPQFTELEMDDTVIQLIGSPNQYERLIDGVRYGVYEKRYVIFPQRSGPLEIPDILFRGEVTDGSSNFVFRNLNTRRVTAFIDGITIDVKERPAAAQDLENWLPATSLTLEESWSRDLSELEVGSSVTRTLTITAEGLDGAMLPAISPTDIEGVNQYEDPPEIERTYVDGRIVGTRIETTSIVPTEAGNLEIPELSVAWWNVDSDQLEVSVVPASRIDIASIAGDLPSEQAVASTDNLEDLLRNAPAIDQAMIDAQAEAEFIEVDAVWLNILIAVAVLIVLFSIYRLAIAPYNSDIGTFWQLQRDRLAARFRPENNEAIAYRRLRDACKARDLQGVRTALIIWSRHIITERSVNSMEDILQQQQYPQLHLFAASIQNALFNASADQRPQVDFQPEDLQREAAALRKNRQQHQRQHNQRSRYALPPLYRI